MISHFAVATVGGTALREAATPRSQSRGVVPSPEMASVPPARTATEPLNTGQCRERAAEAHAMAGMMRNREAEETLLDIARLYDQVAERLDVGLQAKGKAKP